LIEGLQTVKQAMVCCGAYMAGTLGVATFAYLPFAFFNLINPLIAIFLGFTGISIKKIDKSKTPKDEKSE